MASGWPNRHFLTETAELVGLSTSLKAARMSVSADLALPCLVANQTRRLPCSSHAGSFASVQLDIAIRHGHLSEDSQAMLKSKAEKLARFFERLTAIEIIVDLSDEQSPQVDIKASAEHKHDFVAHEKSDNLMKSFESAVQKIEQQLRKYKQRVQQKHRTAPSRRQEPSPTDSEEDES